MKRTLLTIVSALLLCACSGLQMFQPTPTPTATPTLTPAPTLTPTPLPTLTPLPLPTRDEAVEILRLLPEKPQGFEWKIIADKKLAVLLPSGWFFKVESDKPQGVDGVYISKENIDETGRFSTGQSVLIYKNLKGVTDLDRFAKDLLIDLMHAPTTKETLKAWDYKTDQYTVHHLRVRAEYPNESGPDKNKIVQYSTIPANNAVYLVVFESPEEIWEQTIQEFGIMLDYVVIISE